MTYLLGYFLIGLLYTGYNWCVGNISDSKGPAQTYIVMSFAVIAWPLWLGMEIIAGLGDAVVRAIRSLRR